jgi:predicted house-cleaning noncanonical NTP pyrophosphatase (MazG superfamily)
MLRECQKLVRDRIPELLDKEGIAYESSTLSNDAFRPALYEKLLEEAEEVAGASPAERLKELADVWEVLETIARSSGFTLEQVRAVQQERREARGGFEKRILLHWFEE